MTMRKLGLLALACLLATSAVAGNVVKDRDWPNNAPMLALHPDGTGFLLLADPRTGRNVEATALLRIAEQQNPGLMATFGKQLFQQWLVEGRITRRSDGTLDWGTQENFDDLNACSALPWSRNCGRTSTPSEPKFRRARSIACLGLGAPLEPNSLRLGADQRSVSSRPLACP